MDKFWIPPLLALIFRLGYTKLVGADFDDFSVHLKYEFHAYAVCFVLGFLWFYHRFIRERCPECDTVDPRITEKEEIDRFVGSKQVTGRDGKGRTTTEHVSVTFVKMRNHYRCSSCRHEWTTLTKHELA